MTPIGITLVRVQGGASKMPGEKIQFGDIDSARKLRNRRGIRGFLAEDDGGVEKTIRLKSGTPESVKQELRGEAADSRKGEAEKYGQVALTDAERERLDFSETNVLTARSAKAIAIGKGVDDFTSYFDPTLTVDEHRQVFEEAQKDERGQRGGRGLDDDREIQRRMADAHNTVKQEQLPRAKDAAFTGDVDAQTFVRDRTNEFDIGYNRTNGSLVGYGADFERLQDRHEQRSGRAQTIDEKRSAPVTRDPFEWVNNPSKVDYPGIDTIDPAAIHASRSERARKIDEREFAPVTSDKEKWANNPDEWDYRDVDTPSSFDIDVSEPDIELTFKR